MQNVIKEIKYNIKNNKGFSIAELIVSFAILAFVSLAVVMMMSAGSNMFTRVDEDINLQYKSQNAMSQFQQYFMGCSSGICQMDNNVIYFADAGNIYAFRFEEDENKIYFGESPKAGALTALAADNINVPFSSDVSAFDVEINAASGKARSVKVTLTVQKNSKTFTTSQIFSFRNNPVYIKDPDESGSYLQTLVTAIS